MDKSAGQYLFNSEQRKMLMSLFDKFDETSCSPEEPLGSRSDNRDFDCDEADIVNCQLMQETDSTASTASSYPVLNGNRQKSPPLNYVSTSSSSFYFSATKSDAQHLSSTGFSISSWRPALSGQYQPQPADSETLPPAALPQPMIVDSLSCNSSVKPQSAVDSVSTMQATEIVTSKAAPNGLRRRSKAAQTGTDRTGTQESPATDDTLCQRKRRRRGRKNKRRNQWQKPDQQAAMKAELFSQYLCSGLSPEDQQENLRYLLRTAQNRNFWIRSDQRKNYIDLKLQASRRETPIRVNRTTQLRLQRLEAAQAQQRNRAIRLTRNLSEGRQLKLRQQRQQKQQAELQDQERRRQAEASAQQAERERSELRRQAVLQRRQSNRNALGVPSSSNSRCTTLTSPSGTRTVDNDEDRDAATTLSLVTVTMALDKDTATQRRTQKHRGSAAAEWQLWRQNQLKRNQRHQSNYGSPNDEDEKLSCFGSGDVQQSLLESQVSQQQETQPQQKSGAISNRYDKDQPMRSHGPQKSPRIEEVKEEPQPSDDIEERATLQCENEADFSAESIKRRAVVLERLRQEFLGGVDARLFSSEDTEAPNSPGLVANQPSTITATANTAGCAADDLSSLGGQLFVEFSELKTDLARLLDAKREALSANTESVMRGEEMAENQRQLNAKVRQLDSLIKRVMQHLDSSGGSSSPGGLSDVPVSNNKKDYKFAEIVSLDSSANAAVDSWPPVCQTTNTEQGWQKDRSLSPCHPTAQIYQPVNPVCMHCASPVRNHTISSSSMAVNSSGHECDKVLEKSMDSQQKVASAFALAKDSVYNSEHAKRIVAQMRYQLDIMRRASEGLWLPQPSQPEHQPPSQQRLAPRFKSLGDPVGAMQQRRRVSRQRAIERDPSEARFIPLMLRLRKWRVGTPKFQAFAANRCTWCQRYRETVLPMWTNVIRADLSLHEPIGDSLLLLGSRLGKPLSPDWVLSTSAFPDDGCPGHATIIDLKQTPHKAGLKPWQTIFVSESTATQTLAMLAEASTRQKAAPKVTDNEIVPTADREQQQEQLLERQEQSNRKDLLQEQEHQVVERFSPIHEPQAAQTQIQAPLPPTPPTLSSTPTNSATPSAALARAAEENEAGTLTVLPPKLARVCEQRRVRAAIKSPNVYNVEQLAVSTNSEAHLMSTAASASSMSCHRCHQCVCEQQQQQQQQQQQPPQPQKERQLLSDCFKGDIYDVGFGSSPADQRVANKVQDQHSHFTGFSGDNRWPMASRPVTAASWGRGSSLSRLRESESVGDSLYRLTQTQTAALRGNNQNQASEASFSRQLQQQQKHHHQQQHERCSIYSSISPVHLTAGTTNSSAAISIQSSVKQTSRWLE